MTLREYADAIRKGDDPLAVLRVAVSEAESSALDRAAESFPISQTYSPEFRAAIRDEVRIWLRALIPPAVAPAADLRSEYERSLSMPIDGGKRALDRVDAVLAKHAPAAETRNDPCQRCGKLGGHPVDFRFDVILMGSWICPHCLAAQEKRIAELEAQVAEANRQLAKLRARAAPPEGEGT